MERNESPPDQAQASNQPQVNLAGLEPLRALDVAVELIPMRSKMALYMFLRTHEQEFPARYMRTFAGKQQRMLYDSEIRRIRELLLVEPGADEYHTDTFQARTGITGRPRTRPVSPIDLVMARAMGRRR